MRKQFIIEFKIADELYQQCGEGYWNCVFAEWERQLEEYAGNLRLSDPHYKQFIKKMIAETVAKVDAAGPKSPKEWR